MRINELHKRHGATPEQRAKMHQDLTMHYLTDWEKEAIEQIRFHLVRGSSQLAPELKQDNISMGKVIYSIKNNRCLAAKSRDLGSTYLETLIGGAIRAVFPAQEINRVRRVFGLAPLAKGEKRENAGEGF